MTTLFFILSCKVSPCQKLALVSSVRVSPSHCLSSNQSYGSTCNFSCAGGYHLNGPSSTRCGILGAWSEDVNTVGCYGLYWNTIILLEKWVSNSYADLSGGGGQNRRDSAFQSIVNSRNPGINLEWNKISWVESFENGISREGLLYPKLLNNRKMLFRSPMEIFGICRNFRWNGMGPLSSLIFTTT